MTTPNEFPEMFSTVVYGGKRSPGTVTLTGHDRDVDWDVQKAKGQTGASSTLNGFPVGQFQATFYLATPADQLAWPAFQRVLESSVSGPEPKALSIFHPDLAVNKFTEVSVSSIGGAARDDRGGVTVLVKFIEYRPPKPKPSTTASSSASSAANAQDGQTRPDPNAELKRELADVLEEAATA